MKKFTNIKSIKTQLLSVLTILALILFLLISCGAPRTVATGGGGTTTPDNNPGNNPDNNPGNNPDNNPVLELPTVSLALNNNVGSPVDLTSSLNDKNTYLLTVSSTGGDVSLQALNYTFSFNPANAVAVNTSSTNLVRFTVINVATTPLKITATHKKNTAVTKTLTVSLRDPNIAITPFAKDIQSDTVPDLASIDPLMREVLEPLGAGTGAALVKRYVTEAGAGSRDGSSWSSAWAATNLRNGISRIADASPDKVYLVMIGGGTYKPDYGTSPSREISFSMKNYVAIMGGFEAEGGWARVGATFMSGDIGTVNDNTDNSYHVFHNNIPLRNSHLYGVTIVNGNANGAFGTDLQWGGGMYNDSSSPNLTQVIFSGNNGHHGGGMYNNSSSPKLTQVTFSENNSYFAGGGGYNNRSFPVIKNTVFSKNIAKFGGGMYNKESSSVLDGVRFSKNSAETGGAIYNENSSPNLTQVTFSENVASIGTGGGMHSALSSNPVLENTVFSRNTAKSCGGAMYISSSSLNLTRVVISENTANRGAGVCAREVSLVINNTVFSGNTATQDDGGGMYTWYSFPVLVGVVFSGNSARNGGAMLNDNDGRWQRPVVVNTIFSGNSATGVGPDLVMLRDSKDGSRRTEKLNIAGSVLGLGLANPTNGIIGHKLENVNTNTQSMSMNYYNLTNLSVNLTGTTNLTVNEVEYPYPIIQAGSSAIDLGVYVRRSESGETASYYYSTNESTWYNGFSATGGWGNIVTLPVNTEDLTATDITGKARTGRPDAGVNEF